MMIKPHNWTDEEINLLHDTTKSVREIAEKLRLREGTVRNKRYALGIKGNQSKAMTGRSRATRSNKLPRETRECINPDCTTTFEVMIKLKKKYCSHSCQQKTNNVAAKGLGSRKIRNPNIKEYTKYARKVHGLSGKVYNVHKKIINPQNYPRTLCGVEGGWQLDHIKTIKECFEKGMSVEDASAVSNLRMLPWKENLMRNFD